MRTIFVVTHCEATHHVDGLVGGWFDSQLTKRGQADAVRIADALASRLSLLPAPEIYTSDLRRASETADAIASRFASCPIVLKDLREKSYGQAEGRPQQWLDQRFIAPPAVGDRMNHIEGIEAAETKHTFATRIYKAVQQIVDSPVQSQIVVTHGFALTYVIAAWIGMPLQHAGYANFKSSSGGITELHEDDFFHNRFVVRLNDTDHLAK